MKIAIVFDGPPGPEGPRLIEDARRILAFDAFLRSALKWDSHTDTCVLNRAQFPENLRCNCGYDEKAKAEKELRELLKEDKS